MTTQGVTMTGEAAAAPARPQGWQAVMCGACRAFGLATGVVMCGVQLAALAIAVGLVVLLFVY